MKVVLYKKCLIDKSGYIVYNSTLASENLSVLCDAQMSFSNTTTFFPDKLTGSFKLDLKDQTYTESDLSSYNYVAIDDWYFAFINSYVRVTGSLYEFSYVVDAWHTYLSNNITISNIKVTRYFNGSSLSYLSSDDVLSRIYEPKPSSTYTRTRIFQRYSSSDEYNKFACVISLVTDEGAPYLCVLGVMNSAQTDIELTPFNDDVYKVAQTIYLLGVDGGIANKNCSCTDLYLVPYDVINNFISEINQVNWVAYYTSEETYALGVIDFGTNSHFYDFTYNMTTSFLYANRGKTITIGTPNNFIEIPFKYFNGDTSLTMRFFLDNYTFNVTMVVNGASTDITTFFNIKPIFSSSQRAYQEGKMYRALALIGNVVSLGLGIFNGASSALASVPNTVATFGGLYSGASGIPNTTDKEANIATVPKGRANMFYGSDSNFVDENYYSKPHGPSSPVEFSPNLHALPSVIDSMTKYVTFGRQYTFTKSCDLSPMDVFQNFGIIVWNSIDQSECELFIRKYGFNYNGIISSSSGLKTFITSKRIIATECTLHGCNDIIANYLAKQLSKGVYVCDTLAHYRTALLNGYY